MVVRDGGGGLQAERRAGSEENTVQIGRLVLGGAFATLFEVLETEGQKHGLTVLSRRMNPGISYRTNHGELLERTRAANPKFANITTMHQLVALAASFDQLDPSIAGGITVTDLESRGPVGVSLRSLKSKNRNGVRVYATIPAEADMLAERELVRSTHTLVTGWNKPGEGAMGVATIHLGNVAVGDISRGDIEHMLEPAMPDTIDLGMLRVFPVVHAQGGQLG